MLSSSQIQNNPVYSLPFLYMQGLQIVVTGNTTFTIGPGQARDSNDIIDIPVGFQNLEGVLVTSPLIVNGAINGAGGLDQGTLAANNHYVVYLIADSRYYLPTAGLISLSSNAFPLLPFGYDSYRAIGNIYVDVSTAFINTTSFGSNNARTVFFIPGINGLLNGNATAFANVNLSSILPLNAQSIVTLDVRYTPATAGNSVTFRPIGSTATANLPTVIGQVAAIEIASQITMPAGISGGVVGVQYQVTNAGDSVDIYLSNYSVSL